LHRQILGQQRFLDHLATAVRADPELRLAQGVAVKDRRAAHERAVGQFGKDGGRFGRLDQGVGAGGVQRRQQRVCRVFGEMERLAVTAQEKAEKPQVIQHCRARNRDGGGEIHLVNRV